MYRVNDFKVCLLEKNNCCAVVVVVVVVVKQFRATNTGRVFICVCV